MDSYPDSEVLNSVLYPVCLFKELLLIPYEIPFLLLSLQLGLVEKFYDNGQKFLTMFPDGTGNVLYPSLADI